jgi:hypothetical protein
MPLIEYLFPLIVFPLEFYTLRVVFQNNNIPNFLHNFEILGRACLELFMSHFDNHRYKNETITFPFSGACNINKGNTHIGVVTGIGCVHKVNLVIIMDEDLSIVNFGPANESTTVPLQPFLASLLTIDMFG